MSDPTGDRRVRLLVIVPSLRGGGAERVMTTLLRHLDRSRFQTTLCVVDMRAAAYSGDLPDDVDVVDLRCSRVRFAVPRIVRLIRRDCPDVVLSTLGHLNIAIAAVRPLLPNGIKYIAREACVVTEYIKDSRMRTLWEWAYRHLYRRFDVVICQSRDMQDDLVRRFALPQWKTALIHNPVDLERIGSVAYERRREWQRVTLDDRPLMLVAAGRLVPQKGFDILIEALSMCRNCAPCLTILGEGPLRSTLEALAVRLGLAGRVLFAGFVRNPYAYFAGSDAFVLSSRYEGFPNVVLEALACGTRVIATPAPGGVAEIARLVGGVTVAQALDPRSLCAAIEQFAAGNVDARVPDLANVSARSIVRKYEELMLHGLGAVQPMDDDTEVRA